MTYDEFVRYLRTLGAFFPEKSPTIKVYIDDHKCVEFELTNKGVEAPKSWENNNG